MKKIWLTIKDKIYYWLFSDRDAKVKADNQEAINGVLNSEKEIKTSADFLSRQLMQVEQECFSAKAEVDKLRKNNIDLEQKVQKLSLPRDITILRSELDFSSNPNSVNKTLKFFKEMKTDLKIKYKRVHGPAAPPVKMVSGDAGYDLFQPNDGASQVAAGEIGVIDTGLLIEIPEGYYGRIASRTSLAMRSCCVVVNEIIDSNFRGTVKVILFNFSNEENFRIEPGQRVAQLIIEKVSKVKWVEDDSLKENTGVKPEVGSTGK